MLQCTGNSWSWFVVYLLYKMYLNYLAGKRAKGERNRPGTVQEFIPSMSSELEGVGIDDTWNYALIQLAGGV